MADLWIYDFEQKRWTNLGAASIGPDDWGYIQPTWNPWFSDGSRLAYFTHDHEVLSIVGPDGVLREDINVDRTGGLALPSPDGQFVAYVTFEPRPMKSRPDLQFWGGTRVWVVPANGSAEPTPVTNTNLDEIYDLRWLDDHTVIFDRVADVDFYKQARVWKAQVPR